jgi:hypothetical protein
MQVFVLTVEMVINEHLEKLGYLLRFGSVRLHRSCKPACADYKVVM